MKHRVDELEGALLGELFVLGREGTDGEGRRLWRCACTCGRLVLFSTKQLRVNGLDYCQSVYHRLVRQTKVDAETNCWLWQGKVNRSGYGVCKESGITRVAHRVMYRSLFGGFPEELRACHRCDNPRCINPFHIFLGTQRDNMLDMHAKGRFGGGAKPGNRNSVGNSGWLGKARAEGRLIEFRGKSQCLVHWADELGLPRGTVVCRVRNGWSVERALTTPPRSYRRAFVKSKLGEEVELP